MSGVLFPKLRKYYSRTKQPILPKLPNNILQWIKIVRPKVEGKPRSFLAYPFWKEIYENPSHQIMVLAGRQVFKSTWFCDVLAFEATAKPNSTLLYVTYDEKNLEGFSNEKFRDITLKQNPLLMKFVKGPKVGNVHEVAFQNNSRILMITDENGYRQAEGKSANHILLDEIQYQELEFLPKLRETMTATKGKIKLVGIGGEAGSELEKIWLSTNQTEWQFENPYWRDKLEFDKNGLIYGDYLNDVLRGEWVSHAPDNYLFPGYHLPQTIFPNIPLTIDDAIYKYRVPAEFSIEWKQKNYSQSVFLTNVLGQFYKSARRPITREMVLACMRPYQYLSLLRSDEVVQLKQTYGKKIRILMGVDFGSGVSNSSTVISIIIKWKRENNDQSRYQLVWIEKREAENQMDQSEYITNLFKEYSCDIGVGDLGYGPEKVKTIQIGGANRISGRKFSGVGSRKFLGCRTMGDETKPMMRHETKVDEHGEEVGRIQVDKTQIIQNFIDFLEWYVPHPKYPNDKKFARPKFMIPFKNEFETDWLISDFTKTTRKDLEKIIDVVVDDPRQRPKKEFNHPRDSVMSIIYCLVADKQEEPDYSVGGIYHGRRR